MLKKYLLPGCLIAALTACGGGQDLDYGPTNDSIPDSPPPAPEYVPQWRFSDASDLDDWTIEWNKPGSGNAEDSEIEWHDSQFALEIHPNWGGESVAKNDNITVYGTLPEPMDISYGTIYLSLYYTREHLGNPWGTGPYWGQSAHHMGTQYLLIDADGNRALLDTGNGGNWMNSFDIGNPNNNAFLRTDPEARGNQNDADTFETDEVGYWFDLAIKVGDEYGLEAGVHYFPNGDNAGTFDPTNVVSFGVVMQYALEFPTRNTDAAFSDAKAYWDQFDGASERYIYIDEVALVPGEQPPPPPVEPPPAIEVPPEFGLPIYREEALESGFNDAWGGDGATANFDSDYGAKSGASAIELVFDGAGSQYQIGAPDQTLDLTNFTTLDFSVWVDFENEQDSMKLWISLCDCDDGIEVTVTKESWNDISIPVADFGKDFLYGTLGIKNNSAAGGTIYLDDMGFDKVPDLLPPTFDLPVYYDTAPEAGFSIWGGWGGTYSFESLNRYETGENAIELAYTGGYGSAQIGSGTVDISGQLYFHMSAYLANGGPETTTLLVQLCGNGVGCGDNDGVQVTVNAGEWTRYSLPIADFTGLAQSIIDNGNYVLSEIRIKNYTDSDKLVYVDNIGFDANISPDFAVPAYRDALDTGFAQWDGWGGTYDFASTEVVRSGSRSIEAVWDAGAYGAVQMGVSNVDLTPLTNFEFSAYLPEGYGDTATLIIKLCGGGEGCADNQGVQVVVDQGGWMDIEVPVASFTALPGNTLTELRIQNLSDAAKTMYFDNIGFDEQPLPVHFDIPVFLDTLGTGYSQWDGWGGTYNLGYTEMAHHGYVAGEFAYDGGYGAMQIGNNVDISAMSTFHITAWLLGTDDSNNSEQTTLLIQLCGGGLGCGDNDGAQITVTESGWQSFTLDIATDFPAFDPSAMTEIRIKNYTDSSKTVYVDTIGFNQ